jgi:hypothetical protein
MQEPVTQTEGQAASVPVHPEEIRASVDLHIGNSVSLKAMVRTTPAGLVTAGVMVAAIVLSIAALVRVIQRRDLPKGSAAGSRRALPNEPCASSSQSCLRLSAPDSSCTDPVGFASDALRCATRGACNR